MAKEEGFGNKVEDVISLTSFSAPIIERGRITGYMFAKINMTLSNLKYGLEVCEKRFDLADQLLLVLHNHPLDNTHKKEQQKKAEARLHKVIETILGPGIVSDLSVHWSRQSGGNRAIFGLHEETLCNAE